MTRALITGSRGFIGEHLADALAGNHDVLELDRRTENPIDLSRPSDEQAIAGLVEQADEVYHLAAPSKVGAYEKKPALVDEAVAGTERLLRLCHLHEKPVVVA